MNENIQKGCLTSQYDKISALYDNLFTDEKSKEENACVASMVKSFNGSVYDVGCGTGLFLEINQIPPSDYFGIDPSWGMLNEFINKYPSYKNRVKQIAFEDDDCMYKKFDNIISLFGSISYVDKNSLIKIQESRKDFFLMFYKKGYYPQTYVKTKMSFQHNETDIVYLKKIFYNAIFKEFNNYLIIKSK